MNHAVALEAGFSGKRTRNDTDAKVAFAVRMGAGMTGMKVAFIRHPQLRRRQRLHQQACDSLADRTKRHSCFRTILSR